MTSLPTTVSPAAPARIAVPFPVVGRPPLPRRWPIRPADIALGVLINGVVVAGMWVRHGGLDQLGLPAGLLTGAGQITALLGTYLALVGILFMARVPWIDHVVGSDRLMIWHRWLGFATFWLILGHFVFTTVGWALGAGVGILTQLLDLLSIWDVLIATVGFGLLVMVAVTSIRYARRHVQYETWYGLHLYAYLAVALAFLHQVTLGTDLVSDPLALWYWVALYLVTFGLLLVYRVGAPFLLTLRHRPRVANVVREAPDVVSVYVTGRHLDRLAVRAGQWFHVRFLTGGGWWRHHPYSISAAPNGAWLRLTIKDLGDDTHAVQSLAVGVPVFLEGPYGAFTADLAQRPRVVMLAGGVGVTPLRAILEELPPAPGRVTLLYREGSPDRVLFQRELAAIAEATGADVRLLVGHRGSSRMPADPLQPANLLRLVPDVAAADVFVCGSRPFTERTLASLRSLGVPADHIHAERFEY